MITSSYCLTATERVLPRLALDFTTASLDSRITFTRALNTATRINASGVIETVNADVPRFDYNPTTLVCNGLLIEEARTNLLLNSLIDGTSLTTQSVTVTAAAHTLSFYGTGTVGLSGAHTATVVGTGAYPTRTTLTFTPTAGSLTLTVSGTIQFANLTLGSFVTSFIPTDGTIKTRNADVATMTGTNFSDWFNASEGTIFVDGDSTFGGCYWSIDAGTNANRYFLFRNSTTASMFRGTKASANIFSLQQTQASSAKCIAAYKNANFGYTNSGVAPATSALADDITGLTQLNIGKYPTATTGVLYIRKIMYWPQRLLNAELQAFTK